MMRSTSVKAGDQALLQSDAKHLARLHENFISGHVNGSQSRTPDKRSFVLRFNEFFMELKDILRVSPYRELKASRALSRRLDQVEQSFFEIPPLAKTDTVTVKCSRVNSVLNDGLEMLGPQKDNAIVRVLIETKMMALKSIMLSVSREEIIRSSDFFLSKQMTSDVIKPKPHHLRLKQILRALIIDMEFYFDGNKVNFDSEDGFSRAWFFAGIFGASVSSCRVAQDGKQPIAMLIGNLKIFQRLLDAEENDISATLSRVAGSLKNYVSQYAPKGDLSIRIATALRDVERLSDEVCSVSYLPVYGDL